ncbi:MAG: CBS domain-containing protein [Acidobacteria bacterium]|nr:CBS domain-containing protein [Acidobacteriota bacterium]
MAKTPIVRKYMKKASKTFRENEEMAPCMSILARSSFAAIPVVNDDGEVVGLLTEKDVIRTIINWAYDQRAGGNVGEYLSPLEVIVTPEMDLLTAARAFLECDFACLPVLDEDRLVGRITRHDVLCGLEKWATEINRERAGRLTKTPDHERPSAMGEIQKVAASHTREQLSQIFRKH